jgi:hypothetical protein
MIIFPHDCAAIERDADWRDELFWPTSLRALRDATLGFSRKLMQANAQLETEEQRLTYVAAMQLFAPWANAVVEAANTLNGLGGTEFASDLPEVLFMSGRAQSNPGAAEFDTLIKVGSCRRPLARQLVWTAQWTPLWRLPATLAAPEVVAFNRNPGLILTAQASRRRIRYDNVEAYYAEIRDTSRGEKNGEFSPEALRELLSSTLQDQWLAEPIKQRLLELMVARLQPILNGVSSQMRALRQARSLPQEIWTGTGGYWPSRIVGLEIMRRGGTVRRFDHGYNYVLNRCIEQAVYVEAMVSTHFVFVSEDCARRWRKEPVGELVSPAAAPQFESFPRLAAKAAPKPARPNGTKRSRPKVLYASGQLKGMWRNLPPPMPTMIHVDWTLRVAEMLQKMPIDLVCRPHPGGVFAGKPHPLSRSAQVPNQLFEQLIDDVDVVITDSPFSRVICQALCTDKPIVYLDPGYDYFCESVLPLVKQRCSMIDVHYDSRGLPQVDAEQLETALLDAKKPDGELVRRFRQLFAAE